MADEEVIRTHYRQLFVLVVPMLVLTPLIFLYIVYGIFIQGSLPVHSNPWILYGGLAISAAVGACPPIVKRSIIAAHHRSPARDLLSVGAARPLFVIGMAFIEFSYLMGVVVFFLTGQRDGIPYFYALGILFSLLYWPTKSRFRAFIEQLEAK